MLSKINPTQTNSWKALDEHFGGNDFDLRSLFHYNPNRFSEFSLQKDNYLFDYSKKIGKIFILIIQKCMLNLK